MTEPEQPSKKSARLIAFAEIPEAQPDGLSEALATRIVRQLAVDSDNIVLIDYALNRMSRRRITRPQVEKCVRRGTIQEGPFINPHGHWQMNFFRHAAGEQVTCVVAIDWPKRILVINAF